MMGRHKKSRKDVDMGNSSSTLKTSIVMEGEAECSAHMLDDIDAERVKRKSKLVGAQPPNQEKLKNSSLLG